MKPTVTVSTGFKPLRARTKRAIRQLAGAAVAKIIADDLAKPSLKSNAPRRR